MTPFEAIRVCPFRDRLGPFVGITGLVWAPEDGHVWIAAPGGVMESDLFVMDPLPGWTTPFSRPYISRVTDNGTILVIDRDAPDGGSPDSGDDAVGDPEAAVLPYEGVDNVGYDDPDYGLSGTPNGPWSQPVSISVEDPVGVDREAYEAFNGNPLDPPQGYGELLRRFPTSTYAAFLVWEHSAKGLFGMKVWDAMKPTSAAASLAFLSNSNRAWPMP